MQFTGEDVVPLAPSEHTFQRYAKEDLGMSCVDVPGHLHNILTAEYGASALTCSPVYAILSPVQLLTRALAHRKSEIVHRETRRRANAFDPRV